MKTPKQTKPSIKLERRTVTKKLHGVVTLTAILGATLLLQTTVKVIAAPPAPGIKNVGLVHGAFADGSGWEAVANILKKDGYTVSVVQHPETSFAGDVKFTKAEIDRQSGPVVLVGHSYGGAVVTEAGNDPKVAALLSSLQLSGSGRTVALSFAIPSEIFEMLPKYKGAHRGGDHEQWGCDRGDPCARHLAMPVSKASTSWIQLSAESSRRRLRQCRWKVSQHSITKRRSKMVLSDSSPSESGRMTLPMATSSSNGGRGAARQLTTRGTASPG